MILGINNHYFLNGMNVKRLVFWNITPCSLLNLN
jgi:hypothetical protein